MTFTQFKTAQFAQPMPHDVAAGTIDAAQQGGTAPAGRARSARDALRARMRGWGKRLAAGASSLFEDFCAGLPAKFTITSSAAKALALSGAMTSALILGAPAAQAQSQYLAAQGVLVVRNDPGGVVSARASEISRLRAQGIRVELRGEVCLSSCTMYLALANTCVFRGTTFGFHGPSYYGAKLSQNDFEYWSQVIASHYPPRLRSWFLSTARYKVNDYYRVKGAELIRMGVPECLRA